MKRCGVLYPLHQHEVRREGNAALSTADGHYLVLQGLTQDLKVGLPELGKLIQKENATMAGAYLARPGPTPADDQPNECSKCGTLADESTRIFGNQGALKRGYLIGKVRLNWCRCYTITSVANC